MRNILYFLSLTLVVILFITCVEKIDLPSNQEFDDSIGISAKLYFNDYQEATVEISGVSSTDDTRAFDDDFNFQKVFVENSLGQKWEIPALSPGLYVAVKNINDPDFNLGFDQEYRIELKLFNGQTIYSDFESVYGDKISADIEYDLQGEIGNVSNISTLVSIDPSSIEGDFRIFPVETYKFSEISSETGSKSCYFRNELYLDNITLVNNEEPSSNLVDLIPYSRKLPDFLRAEGFVLDIVSEGLSPGAYKYWSQVKKLLERTGNLFDEAPGILSSNLHNDTKGGSQPIGYFYVTVQQSNLRFFSAVELQGFERPLCPIFNQIGEVNEACYDCSTLRGALTAPPRYWPNEE